MKIDSSAGKKAKKSARKASEKFGAKQLKSKEEKQKAAAEDENSETSSELGAPMKLESNKKHKNVEVGEDAEEAVVKVKEGNLGNNELYDLIESEFESESEESDSEQDDVKLTEPSKTSIYNKDGLLEKLNDISWPKNVEWIHKLSIDVDQQQEVDVNDDLARELAFYTQALEGTRQAFQKLESLKIPFLRPVDYYAEMVKTDTHMEKVKGRLLAEKKNIEEADERRKAREAKKISKEVQAQKMKERAKQKKDDIESVKKWRKQRQQTGFPGGDKGADMGFSFEDGKSFERSNKRRPGVGPGDRSGGKARLGVKGKKPMKRRESRDSKFGHGGRKGMRKQNTADTTNDFKGFKKGNANGDKKRKR